MAIDAYIIVSSSEFLVPGGDDLDFGENFGAALPPLENHRSKILRPRPLWRAAVRFQAASGP
jgi:hypothetical protein